MDLRPHRGSTLEDVAARSGVSSATVSRFLNKPGVVAATTGERIRRAVAEIGYVPNRMAGGLASSKSRLVAVQIPYLSNSPFSEMIEAIAGELAAADINVTLGLSGFGADGVDLVVRAALSRRVHAIVITGDVTDETRVLLRQSGTTVLQMWDLPEDPIDIAVGFSHRDVGRDIARFLKRGVSPATCHDRRRIARGIAARGAYRRKGSARRNSGN